MIAHNFALVESAAAGADFAAATIDNIVGSLHLILASSQFPVNGNRIFTISI
jgi:hypothetical protein